ncbi:MAG TPA: AAA family ATPase [Opitutaceae bacterium]|nr:AAA family ATPase [Opitutaceae bacterium]
MIASVAFRNFKALRATSLALAPFNLVIGPNGSGKTSLIESLLRLRALAKLPPAGKSPAPRRANSPEIDFRFLPPHEAIEVHLRCTSDTRCDALEVVPSGAAGWPALRAELAEIRGYVLDHVAMGAVAARDDHAALQASGGNLAAVLARIRAETPAAFDALTEEMLRTAPEFRGVELTARGERVELGLKLAEDGVVPAEELSQGMLYLLAILTLAFDPHVPRLLCIEEVDRGVHPRLLREVRDALYRLSHPEAAGLARRPVQIVATTHSPYFIDLFREHPDEVVVAHKHGRAAKFERLSDRADLPESLREGSLGDMWFSGILGGVPEER